jgi:hypothetical protein
MPARDGSVAVSGLVVIFGNDAVETIATVAIYHFYQFGHPEIQTGHARTITRKVK